MIPVYKPFLDNNERKLILEAFDSSWISSKGDFIKKFENELGKYTKRKNVILVNNGTTALHAALLALDIGEGDQVITNSFSYVATSNAIKYVGAKPVFIDCDPNTWNIDLKKLEKKINNKTKAILVANVYGNPFGIDKIEKIAKEKNIFLIEDAAESLGSEIKSRKSGSFGVISTLSFFGNKTITTGEGGALLVDDVDLNLKIRKLINQGNSNSKRYYHDCLGYNYRITNIQAAIGYAQIKKINEILMKKQFIRDFYFSKLSKIVKFQNKFDTKSSNWLISIVLKSEEQKKSVEQILNVHNIESRPLFYPIPDLPYYESNDNEVLNARELRKKGISLPSYPSLTKEDLNLICGLIKNNLK